MHLQRLLSFAIVAASMIGATALAGHDRTIYINGKIFTSNAQDLWAQGLVVEDGRVHAVGNTAHVLAFREDDSKVVDLNGLTMIPGFNDAHVHAFDSTSFPAAIQLNSPADFVPGRGPTLAQVLELVRNAAKKQRPGTWLMATIGEEFIEDPNANRFALREAAPDHPVLAVAWFGHGTYLNDAALKTLGIPEEPQDPFGGFWERVPGSKVTTGIAHEYAEHRIRESFAAQMSDRQLLDVYERFGAQAARAGYTSVQSMFIGPERRRMLGLLSQARLPIRWREIGAPLALNEECEQAPPSLLPRPFAKKTASGCKWIFDGTHIERLAFLRKEYADAPDVRGRLNFSVQALEATLRRALAGPAVRSQALYHMVGDGTADTLLDAMTRTAPARVWRPLRLRCEHCTLLRQDRLAQARNLGIVVTQNPTHFLLDAVARKRLAGGALAEIDPMRSLLDNGIPVAIGSDAIVNPGNPFLDLFAAVIQPTNPAQALTVQEAVIAYTRTSAQAEFQELWKGTLERGKAADMVVLSQNIFDIPLHEIPRILATQVHLTIVGGEHVFSDGTVQAVSVSQLR
jgi:predicted amidohydrolase YtcJ